MSVIYEKYIEDGYVIIPGLIKNEKIDLILKALENFKSSKLIYFSQSEHNWRAVNKDLDGNGFLNCSFENFTNLIWANKLSKYGRNILQSKEVCEKLKELSNENDFAMWQNMLFDKSTGTVDHLDSWYLDTNPNGKLIAAWFALEDINGQGGSFHIYPGSHKEMSRDWLNKSHDDYVDWCNKLSDKYKRKDALLNKGDVLFWHPSLLHGSSLQKENGYSRKSLTAHYFPLNYLQGRGGDFLDPTSQEYEKKILQRNKTVRSFGYPIAANITRKKCISFCLKGICRYLINQNKPKLLMNRENYELDK